MQSAPPPQHQNLIALRTAPPTPTHTCHARRWRLKALKGTEAGAALAASLGGGLGELAEAEQQLQAAAGERGRAEGGNSLKAGAEGWEPGGRPI